MLGVGLVACGNEATQVQATLPPVPAATLEPETTSTPQATATATNTPTPTVTAIPTDTPQPTETSIPTETPISAEIGDTYFDAEKGYDVYFDGSEYVDEVNYVVRRIREGSEKVVMVGLYGTLTADQDKGELLMKQHLFGLTKWRENAQVFEAAGFNLESADTFWEGIKTYGIPEGINAPANRASGRFNMNNPITAGPFNTERIILHVYRGDQVGPIKYNFGELSDKERSDGVKYKIDGQDIILYNQGNGVQAGFGFIDIGGERYSRYVVIDGTSDEMTDLGTRTTLQIKFDLRQKSAIFFNDMLYHYGLLPELAQQLEDSGSIANKYDKFAYFFDKTQPYVGAGVGNDYVADPNAIQILIPAEIN